MNAAATSEDSNSSSISDVDEEQRVRFHSDPAAEYSPTCATVAVPSVAPLNEQRRVGWSERGRRGAKAHRRRATRRQRCASCLSTPCRTAPTLVGLVSYLLTHKPLGCGRRRTRGLRAFLPVDR